MPHISLYFFRDIFNQIQIHPIFCTKGVILILGRFKSLSNYVMVPSGLELCSKITQTNLCSRSRAGSVPQLRMPGTYSRASARGPLAVAPCPMGGFGWRTPVCFSAPLSWAVQAVGPWLPKQMKQERELGAAGEIWGGGECPFQICWYTHGSAYNSGQLLKSSGLSPQPWDFH